MKTKHNYYYNSREHVEAYKILTLIGSILGLLVTVGALGIVGLLTMGFQVNPNYEFLGIVISAIIVYIIALCVTFGVKSTKAIGITLIVSAILILIFSSFYGICSVVSRWDNSSERKETNRRIYWTNQSMSLIKKIHV